MNDSSSTRVRGSWFSVLAPGILVAATGVGAGDLMTASLAGAELGVGIAWAAAVGVLLKWGVNEGLARWQMATRTTLLEGWIGHFGWPFQIFFVAYLLVWTFATSGALMSACGVGASAILPLGDPAQSKIIWGLIHSIAGVALVWIGGFRLFERLMSVCIGVMFVTVMLTAILIFLDASTDAARPSPPAEGKGYGHWVLAVLGGVGGTLTVLSYGYWIREHGRQGWDGVRASRLDLAVGYGMTGMFGAAMILIGSRVPLADPGSASKAATLLADQLEVLLGPAGLLGRWLFLIGFWGAVFSSLLGVWQGVPYLFADYLSIRRGTPGQQRGPIDFSRTKAYRGYLIAMATLPAFLLWQPVRSIQLTYAVLGSVFMPVLALSLLVMNNRTAWVGQQFRSGVFINLVLVATLLFFSWFGYTAIAGL